jgi:uncharacterized phage protein (TIGR02218 family)
VRTVSVELAAFLAANTVGIVRHLFTITPRVGSVVYWTDHKSDLTIGGHTFLAGGTGTVPVITLNSRTEYAGTEIGSCEITLGCGTAAEFAGVRLPLAATSRAFDGAVVLVERVVGAADVDLTLGAMYVFKGIVAEVRPSSTVVELEIEDGLSALGVEIPHNVYRAGCTNVLFDTQCGLVKATYTEDGTVGSGATTKVVPSNLTDATGYYDLGVLTFKANTTTVALRSLSRAVRSYSNTNGAFTLDRPLPAAPSATDTFEVYPGCPKTLDACENKFLTDQLARFRGFPYMPRDGQASTAVINDYINATTADPMPTRDISDWRWNTQHFRSSPGSAYGDPIPVVYGTTKIGGKTIWRGVRTGRTAPVLTALCEGPIDSVATQYSRDLATSPVPASVAVGTGTRPTQTAWIGLGSTYDLNYPGVAWVGQTMTFDTETVPDFQYEVVGKLAGTGGSDDADPASIIQDLFPNGGPLADADDGYYGAAFPFTIETDVGLDGTAASSFTRYCAQNAFYLSPAYTSRRPAIDVLAEIAASTNSEVLWKEGELWIVPLADTAVGTFTPVTEVRYNFTESDLIGGGSQDPVSVTIDPEEQTYNTCPVVFRERAPSGEPTDGTLAYQDATEEDPDPVDVAARGERRAEAVRFAAICRREHALKISRILAQRQVRARQEIEFSVGWRYAALEPLDLITVTDTLFPFSLQPFQIRKIEEDLKTGVLRITAREWIEGVTYSTAHTTQSSDGATTEWAPYDFVNRSGVVTQGHLAESARLGAALWPNPTSEVAPPTGADETGPEFSSRYNAGAGAYNGSFVRQLTAAASGTTTLASYSIPCIPRETYRFSAQVKRNSGDGSATIKLRTFNVSGSEVSSETATGTTSSSWGAIKIVGFVIPDTAVTVQASIIVTASASQTVGWFDSLDFTRTGSWNDLTVSLSATLAEGTGTDTTAPSSDVTATTGTITATASGWERYGTSGVAATVTSSTSAATTFSRTYASASPANVVEGLYRIKVTDGDGKIVYSQNVTVRTTHLYEPV